MFIIISKKCFPIIVTNHDYIALTVINKILSKKSIKNNINFNNHVKNECMVENIL